jgi:hypothetical protein
MAIRHTEKWALAYGDPNETSVGVTKATFERIMKTCGRHRADALALYLFYAYTARWQHTTNEIWATTRYACDGLGWGKDKLIAVKKQLMALGLVENVMVRDESGRVTQKGWRIRVRFIVGKWMHDECIVDPLGQPDSDQILFLPTLDKSEPKEDLRVATKRDLLANFDSLCEQIWKIYPLKAAKPKGIAAIRKALDRVPFDFLLAKTKAFAAIPNGQRLRWYPQGWFNQEIYNDDPATWLSAPKPMRAVDRNKRKGQLQDELNTMFREAKARQQPGEPLYSEAQTQQRDRMRKELAQL